MVRSALLALALLLAIPAAHAADAQPPRSITVQGTGSASARPDLAVARAGIENRAATPNDALAANTKVMNSLMTVFKRFSIAERDIETTGFNVNPVYAQPASRGAMEIEGYQVSNQVSVRVRDIAKLGELLSALVEAGANRLHGVSFEIADADKLHNEARRAAVEDARHRAELYAAAAGVKIKRVLSIAESGSPAPVPFMARAMKAGAESVPIAGGEQSVGAGVSVVYEIE